MLANGKIRSDVSAAITAYLDSMTKLEKLRQAKAYKEIRGAAADVLQALAKLAAAFGTALADRGFKDNTIMAQYLGQKIDRVRKLMADATLSGEAAGQAAPAGDFRPDSPVWDLKQWSKAKHAAVALGIVVDASTKMTPPLKAAIEAFERVGKLVGKATTAKQKDELQASRIEARRQIVALQNFVNGPLKQQSKHPGWIAYTAAWSKLCDNTLNSSDLSVSP